MKQETMGKQSIVDKMPSWDKNKYSSWRDWAADCYKAGQTSNESQPKDESKEVKEGGELFTGGEWEVSIVGDEIQVQPDKNSGKKYRICGITHKAINSILIPKKEAEANAAIIAQSKNMYYTLKELDNAAMLFADEHNTANALKIGQMLADLHNAHMKAKEILAKANPNY